MTELQLELPVGAPSEPRWERGRREKAESVAIDPSAGEIGAEINLVYPGPRGERGFPICETPGCRRESCGPYSYACSNHWQAGVDDPPSQLAVLPGTTWHDIFDTDTSPDAADAPISRSNSTEDN